MNEILMNEGKTSEHGNTNTVHITVNSFLIGFIDDVYLQFVYAGSDYIWVRIQAQLRLGMYDFEANYSHSKHMLDCFSKQL